MAQAVLLLQGHLPYVRHPEHEYSLEELWLYEAMGESYLPILQVLDRLSAAGVAANIAISLSPTLIAMLRDDLLKERFLRHVNNLIALAEAETVRNRGDDQMAQLSQMYLESYREMKRAFVDDYDGDIPGALRIHSAKGSIELLCTPATFPYLPHYQHYPQVVRSQLDVAVQVHEATFGMVPRGCWLPQCGYYSGLDRLLLDAGFCYTVSAGHALLLANPPARYGTFRPVRTPDGLYVFGRDSAGANLVWADDTGYPADYVYRDFYRDVGFDQPLSYVGEYTHFRQFPVYTGLKYHAVTGPTNDKRPYRPEQAQEKVREHAGNYLFRQQRLARRLDSLMEPDPVFLSPFDMELFGHFWYEGPSWLEELVRAYADQDAVTLCKPSEVLREVDTVETCRPVFSSWGSAGYSEVWLDGSNDWINRHVQVAIERMAELVKRFPNEHSLRRRTLNQAARELLLATGSDWPLLMHTESASDYARRRVQEHLSNFTRIYDSFSRGNLHTEWLTDLEQRHRVFPDIDYRTFGAPRSLS